VAVGVVSYGKSPIEQRAYGTGYPAIYSPAVEEINIEGIDLEGNPTDTGITSTSSSGSSAAATMNAQTNAAKFAAEQQAGIDAAATARMGALQQTAYLRSLLGQGVPSSITGEIGAQETAGREYINTQATNLLARLAGARDTGQQFTTQGYDTLKNYLTANPANAYAQAQRAVPTVTNNALAQYMQAQGVDPSMAQPAVDTANQQALGGATNYNQLLNVLTGAESAGQASRMSEEQMARALAGSQLQSIYGAGRANVESEQLGALNDLAARISNARISAQNEQSQRDQAIQTALAGILGTGYLNPSSADPAVQNQLTALIPGYKDETVFPPPVGQGSGGGVKKSPSVVALEAIPVKTSNTALQKRIDDFVAAKPRASVAAVAKEFPQLAAAIAKKKKK
jgi:hypothetical protein